MSILYIIFLLSLFSNNYLFADIPIINVPVTDPVFFHGLGLLSTGQIIGGGFSSANNVNEDFALTKVSSSGKLDTSFGTNTTINRGLVTTDFKSTLGIPITCTNGINSALILSNGQIVTGGYTSVSDPNYDFAIAKYTQKGVLVGLNRVDIATTLGIDIQSEYTILTPPLWHSKDSVNAIALQTGNTIIAGGTSNVYKDHISFTFARFLVKSLALDTSFGSEGISVINIGFSLSGVYSNDSLSSIAIQVDKKIIAAGSTTYATSDTNFAIMRVNSDGTDLDSSFGKKGIIIVNVSKVLGLSGRSQNSINCIILQPNGQILAAGYSTAQNTLGDFAVARLNANGSLDKTFGTNGIVLTNISSVLSGNSTSQNVASGIVLLDDGSMIVGGLSTAKTTYNPNNPIFNFALVKYKPDGTLDTTFGTKGVVLTAFSQVLGSPVHPERGQSRVERISNDQLNTIALAPGNVIIAGGATNVTDPNFCYGIAAYSSKGNIIKKFGTNGVTVTDFRAVSGKGVNSNDIITTGTTIVVQNNGDIIATGTSNATNNQYDFSLAKYKGINSCSSADTFIQTLIDKYGF